MAKKKTREEKRIAKKVVNVNMSMESLLQFNVNAEFFREIAYIKSCFKSLRNLRLFMAYCEKSVKT